MAAGRQYAAESAHLSHHLLRSAYSLLANTAVTSVLGMAFWVAAARLYTTVEIGRDTVLISVMIELSTVCQLNMGNGIARFLPDLGGRSARALGIVYGLTGAAALLVGSVFVIAAPQLSHELSYMSGETALAVGFVAALALWDFSPCRTLRSRRRAKRHWCLSRTACSGCSSLWRCLSY